MARVEFHHENPSPRQIHPQLCKKVRTFDNSVILPMLNFQLFCYFTNSEFPITFVISPILSFKLLLLFHQFWIFSYCTETHLSPFLLYLPFSLLLVPLSLTACEKIFIRSLSCSFPSWLVISLSHFRLYGTEAKLEVFYSLLVKESMGREDVNKMAAENLRSVFSVNV